MSAKKFKSLRKAVLKDLKSKFSFRTKEETVKKMIDSLTFDSPYFQMVYKTAKKVMNEKI